MQLGRACLRELWGWFWSPVASCISPFVAHCPSGGESLYLSWQGLNNSHSGPEACYRQ